MRWIKIIVALVAFLFAVYSGIMYFFADESKTFRVERVIDYPIDRVFPQFDNFQNLAKWNSYFSGSKDINLIFYQPYEGKGSAMSFYDKAKDRDGEISIQYVNPGKSLKYKLFENEKTDPTTIDIRFKPISTDQTKITWLIQTPKLPLLKRTLNFWSEDIFVENLEKSISNLKLVLGNKIEKEALLTNIKYDSLMVEKQEGELLLGVNVGTTTKKDALFNNIVMNYNKVYNFAINDLGKMEDEVGNPVLLANANGYKDKDLSYFLGIPLTKRMSVTDNNFNFRTLNASKVYVMYFKGDYNARVGSIQKLLQQAKKDTMRNGELQEIFLEAPSEGKDVNLKLALPVFR